MIKVILLLCAVLLLSAPQAFLAPSAEPVQGVVIWSKRGWGGPEDTTIAQFVSVQQFPAITRFEDLNGKTRELKGTPLVLYSVNSPKGSAETQIPALKAAIRDFPQYSAMLKTMLSEWEEHRNKFESMSKQVYNDEEPTTRDLELVNGEFIRNVVVSSVDPDGIKIITLTGIDKILFKDLSDAVKAEFNYKEPPKEAPLTLEVAAAKETTLLDTGPAPEPDSRDEKVNDSAAIEKVDPLRAQEEARKRLKDEVRILTNSGKIAEAKEKLKELEDLADSEAKEKLDPSRTQEHTRERLREEVKILTDSGKFAEAQEKLEELANVGKVPANSGMVKSEDVKDDIPPGATRVAGTLPTHFEPGKEYVLEGLLLIRSTSDGMVADLLPSMMADTFEGIIPRQTALDQDNATTGVVFQTMLDDFVQNGLYRPMRQAIFLVPVDMQAYGRINLQDRGTVLTAYGTFETFRSFESPLGAEVRVPAFRVTKLRQVGGQEIKLE